MPPPDLRPGDAVLVVDVQNDFCPGGALPIPQGDRVLAALNEWLDAARRARVPIYASRDWHPEGHLSFKEQGGPWPEHCLQDSPGAAFHDRLHLPPDVVKVSKGTRFDQDQYSAFDQTGLEARLRRDAVTRLWVGGLAEDVCVAATALDARRLGFEVQLIPGGSLPVTAEGGAAARRRMHDAGIAGAEPA
jgi:nicotinamidase/pyrazinamidase